MKKTFVFEVKKTAQDVRGETVRFAEVEGSAELKADVGLRSTGPTGYRAGQKVRVTIETIEG